MTKPIEWTREVKSTETTLIRTRLAVQQMDRYGSTIAVLAATTADIVAALAAMGEGERAEVLRELDAGPRTAPSWLSDAAEALGEVRPEDGAPLALNWTQVVRAIYDQRAERDNWRARAEKAERERDEAVALQDVAVNRLAVLERERDEARASLDVVRHDLRCTRQELGEARDKLAVRGVTADAFRAATDRAEAALRAERTACDRAEKAERERDEAVALHKELADSLRSIHRSAIHERTVVAEEFDSLRTRLIAAESAAAAREPKEYPLAEGSRWINNVIRSADGTQAWLAGGQVVTDGPLTGALRYTYRQPARDLAALLAKGGLL